MNSIKVTECTVSIETGGYNSAYALKVVINTNASSAMPTATVSMKNGPMAGQTISAWLYVPPTEPGTIAAQFFVRDSKNNWHQSAQSFVPLQKSGSWFLLQETPNPSSYTGPASLVGVQFKVDLLNTDIVVYIDSLGWN